LTTATGAPHHTAQKGFALSTTQGYTQKVNGFAPRPARRGGCGRQPRPEPGQALATHVGCGDTITRDTKLDTANRNGDLGIEAVPGVFDGRGNRARGNGNRLHCLNIACK
jgi:hypothetical protein